MANSYDVRIHTHGTFDASDEAAVWTLPLSGYVVKSGDRICWRQTESEPGGGLGVNFTNGTSNAWVAHDQDGNLTNIDNAAWGWHNRCVDLSPDAGLTVAGVWIGANDAAPGTWDMLFGDIAIFGTDGTVTPLYWRDKSVGLSSVWTNKAGPTDLQAYVETTNASLDMMQPDATTTYYQGDQLGSARMLTAAGGWPLSSDTFYPFGQEAALSSSVNHYKFTGKERDTESGLDYFGARYLSSSMGRFMSPDPDTGTLIHILNPQRWNMYAYALNNPLTMTDPTGKDAAAINFSGMVAGLGHEGILSISPDGSAQYARFGPAEQTASGGWGLDEPGEVQTSTTLPTVQFGANGLPTDASMAALKGALAKIENVSPSTVRINYFKTTSQETANLNAWIAQQKAIHAKYKLCSKNCANFTAGGLVAGGALTQSQANKLSIDPNAMFRELQQNCHTEQTSSTIYDSNGNAISTSQGQAHTVCN